MESEYCGHRIINASAAKRGKPSICWLSSELAEEHFGNGGGNGSLPSMTKRNTIVFVSAPLSAYAYHGRRAGEIAIFTTSLTVASAANRHTGASWAEIISAAK